ncbi:MAG TPA: SRPBCC domain-containing protein, partial [Vicinamibacterales bacterium]|nr:SRPBCC domain-containing protein [Vicinamibacterales bacterium]
MPMTIEKAQVTMPSDREVKVMRSFKAPRALVYKAYTEPALVRQWMLGPPGWSMPVCDMDVRVGGNYSWRWRSNTEDKEFGFKGTF